VGLDRGDCQRGQGQGEECERFAGRTGHRFLRG
jgi:hypothetical protein